MIDARIVELASDPNLVPGVYNTCDQWCDYCPATARCLSFRLRRGCMTFDGNAADPEGAMFASMAQLRDCYEAEGLEPPEDMQMLLAGDRRRACEPANDPIERMAEQYLRLGAMFMATTDPGELRGAFVKRADGPTPLESVLFFHWTIAVKAARAVASAREAARTGRASAQRDADCSAKVALIAIDRSVAALQGLGRDDPDPRLELMRWHLVGLRRELERRFPDARAVVRPGLDEE